MQHRPRRPGGGRRPRTGTRAPVIERSGGPPAAPAAPRGPVELPAALSVKELSERIGASPAAIIRELLQNGIPASINQTIDYETAAIVASDLGVEVHEKVLDGHGPLTTAEEDRPEDLVARPPVVTVM